ncbi:MBL fold metallo-hydrolase [Candidatus Bathyarchaeota archaeon]|nr:MBL fold metallo-hydrolase [Candidatus Bathyarchaeota archaeon]MCK4702699.1 MBL fold metallo-hydrolase [Candidatus Bathyarchaeota archaeon]
MPINVEPEDLVFHILNVGFGDSIIVEFPEDDHGQRSYGIVDCCKYDKTNDYLNKLVNKRRGDRKLKFICATHPHIDHIRGIKNFIESSTTRPAKLWDSGFRHASQTYMKILRSALDHQVDVVRVSSGMEWYYGQVQISALSPSIRLRNKYATYGVDMNNASIVLRFENHREKYLMTRSHEYEGTRSKLDTRRAGSGVVILAGDAEYDSWAHITDEFPRLERTDEHKPLVTKMLNQLACNVIKVSHHGSMHGTSLDVYEKMMPETAIISTRQEYSTKDVGGFTLQRGLFPHPISIMALEEVGALILTTEGCYEREERDGGVQKYPQYAHEGTIVVRVPPGGSAELEKLDDDKDTVPDPP